MTENNKENVKETEKELFSVDYEGITLSFTEDRFDDFEFFEDIEEIQNGNDLKVVPVMRTFLGDQFDAVKEAIRAKCGRVSVKEMTRLFETIMQKAREANPN